MNSGTGSSPNLPTGAWLAEEDGHRVWWAEGGDPAGAPVLIVHGGPGGASRLEPAHWFDGLPVRWILIDQRGCGRSSPAGEVAHNELTALLRDMERLRERLALPRWALAGGSWGARVLLAYVAAHGDRVAGLLLRSPFLGSEAETRRYIAAWPVWLGDAGRDWLGAAAVDAVLALYQRGALQAEDLGALDDERVARAWSAYDDAQAPAGGVAASGARFAVSILPPASAGMRASWRVHAHYARQCWGGEGRVEDMAAWRGPLALVWGEADATCDPAVAGRWCKVCEAIPAVAVPGAGHRLGDPLLAPALRACAVAWVAALRSATGR